MFTQINAKQFTCYNLKVLKERYYECQYLVWEWFKRPPDRVTAAELGRLESTDDVLQRGGYQKILLLQSQLLTLKHL